MKKIAVLVLTALVVLMLASACGGGHKVTRIVTPTPTPTATASPEPAGETGTLSSVTGDVQVLRHDASAWLAATSGMEIWTGDNLKTGSDGYVLITFFDGSVMEMNASAEISVEELSVASGGSTTVHINQVIGNTVNRVESLVDSSSTYEVETPAGSAVVRGTIEVIQVAANGSTTVSIQDEGDVEEHLAYFTAGGVTVTIGEGMTSSCEVGGIPETPFYTSIICISQDVYNLLHDEFQNAVAAYMIAHSGALPPTVGEITIDGETRYLFDMCSLLVSNGGILNIISETVASVLGAGNDNCDLSGCSCNTTGQYAWALDSEGHVYSTCVGNGCLAHNADRYQGACPTPTPPATLPETIKLLAEWSGPVWSEETQSLIDVSGEIQWWSKGVSSSSPGKWRADESYTEGDTEGQIITLFDGQFGYQYLPVLNQAFKYSFSDSMDSPGAGLPGLFYECYFVGLPEAEITNSIKDMVGSEALAISVSGPEDINGQACTRFWWTLSENEQINIWISESGLLVKYEAIDGSYVSTMQFSDVELGVDIDDSIFDINTVAPGVPITGM